MNILNFLTNLVLTMSPINLLRFIISLVTNTISNNIFFSMIALTTGININTFTNTRIKTLFWLFFVFIITLYRTYVLFKKIFLWPFKLGVYTFIGAISGLDLTWFLGWFDFFTLNIPKWVYVQYLTLYSNWINWWYNTGHIKNLNTDLLPSIKNIYKLEDTDEPAESSNKYFNKKNIIIAITVISLIVVGAGIWYYIYSGNTGAGGGGNQPNPPNTVFVNNPPAPNVSSVPSGSNSPVVAAALDNPHQININDNQIIDTNFRVNPGVRYNPINSNLIDRLESLRNEGKISPTEERSLLDQFLRPGPNEAGSSGLTNVFEDYATIERSDSPILPDSPILRSGEQTLRPNSPTGSTDSSDTITAHSGPKDKVKAVIINEFLRRNNK